MTASSPVIDLKSTEIASNWQKAIVEKLPLGRSYSSLWQLAPGVADNRDFAPNAGGNKQDNVFLYDGSNITNPFFGTLGANFSELDIAEFSIKRGAISAEFGRAAGMVTNAITKSGTNTFSGIVPARRRAGGLHREERRPEHRHEIQPQQSGLSLGGPIVKDKLWFYASANLPRSTTTGRINNLGPVPDANPMDNEFFFKLTANPWPSHLITASIRNDSYKSENAGVGVNDHPEVSITGEGLNRVLYLSWAWTISQSTYLEAKYDHVTNDYKSVPNKSFGYQPAFDPAHPERMGYFQTARGVRHGRRGQSGRPVCRGGVRDQHPELLPRRVQARPAPVPRLHRPFPPHQGRLRLRRRRRVSRAGGERLGQHHLLPDGLIDLQRGGEARIPGPVLSQASPPGLARPDLFSLRSGYDQHRRAPDLHPWIAGQPG